ncbi:HP1 family phage holin [[Enterobacter] lignolyticus]|uniref:Prophage Hp1 family holin n=2 Tax=[Enterobacter] lignolyticus TaxID=1334193 RepID=E3G781_ENTLS|nr:HP1 family phage holin [[Enterobacter] lignolyticus]ADO47405.1 putative prophage Hp1 family holin [[Enterobacter] lignolyticus SCF1]ALR77756.1 primosomal protein [[Enterobacter] lignolyticus]
MGLTIDKISTFITYWLSVLLAFFGAQTPEKLALLVGSLCAIFTALVNFWYRRKTWRFLAATCQEKRDA